MQETLPPDAGFVVDWQIADDSRVIDLSAAEPEVILPDDPAVRAGQNRTTEVREGARR